MSGPAPLFREIHRLRRYARDLQEQLDRIPKQRRSRLDRVQRQQQALKDAQEAIRKLRVSASEKEKSLRSHHDQITRYEQQISLVGSKKEFDALQLEIAHAKAECSRLEDEILVAMEAGEEKTAQVPALEKAVKEAQEELAKFDAETAGRQADLKAQFAEATAQLAVIEVDIPPDYLSQYKRTIASLGAEGMAEVLDRNCTACYTEITSGSQRDLVQDKFVICKSCGRILYLAAKKKSADDEDD